MNFKYFYQNIGFFFIKIIGVSNLIGLLLLILVCVICIFSCSEESRTDNVKATEISLIKENDSLHYVQIKSEIGIDRWKLPYPVYQFEIGDVDDNGIEDILVGVIKTTRFDSVLGKRLFIFKNYKGYVRPLWLGSRLGQPLVNFKFIKTNNGARIRSVEKEKSGNLLVAEYKWRRFGVEFTEYIKREIDSITALKILNTIK